MQNQNDPGNTGHGHGRQVVRIDLQRRIRAPKGRGQALPIVTVEVDVRLLDMLACRIAFGPVAQRQLELFTGTMWMMVIVFVLV